MAQEKLLDLISRTANGDRQAFRRLYEDTSPLVYSVLVTLVRRDAVAQEILQDTYLKVWQRAADYHSGRGQVTTWITSIARHRALDVLRANKETGAASDPENEIADSFGPRDAGEQSDDRVRLSQCMAELSSEQRQSIAFAYFKGLTHQELSRQFSVPVNTTKSWVRRGLSKLKECLQR